MPGQARSHVVAPPVSEQRFRKDEIFEFVKSSKKHLIIKQLNTSNKHKDAAKLMVTRVSILWIVRTPKYRNTLRKTIATSPQILSRRDRAFAAVPIVLRIREGASFVGRPKLPKITIFRLA